MSLELMGASWSGVLKGAGTVLSDTGQVLKASEGIPPSGGRPQAQAEDDKKIAAIQAQLEAQRQAQQEKAKTIVMAVGGVLVVILAGLVFVLGRKSA